MGNIYYDEDGKQYNEFEAWALVFQQIMIVLGQIAVLAFKLWLLFLFLQAFFS